MRSARSSPSFLSREQISYTHSHDVDEADAKNSPASSSIFYTTSPTTWPRVQNRDIFNVGQSCLKNIPDTRSLPSDFSEHYRHTSCTFSNQG